MNYLIFLNIVVTVLLKVPALEQCLNTTHLKSIKVLNPPFDNGMSNLVLPTMSFKCTRHVKAIICGSSRASVVHLPYIE